MIIKILIYKVIIFVARGVHSNICSAKKHWGRDNTMSVKVQYSHISGKQGIGAALFLLFGLFSLSASAGLTEPTDPAPNPEYFNLWENSTSYGDLQRIIDDIDGDGVEVSAIDNQDAGAGSGDPLADFNHAIQWETMLIDDDGMRTFMLDVNEPGTTCNGGSSSCDVTSTLGLDELSFFVATTDDFNIDPLITSDEEAFKFWDMDWDEAYAGLLTDSIGSGDFDAGARLPVTNELQDFVNSHSGDDLFVYLYDFTGDADELAGSVGVPGEWVICDSSGNNCQPVADEDLDAVCGIDRSGCSQTNEDSTAGSEDWVYVGNDGSTPTETDVPAPATIFLFGLGGLLIWRQRRKS